MNNFTRLFFTGLTILVFSSALNAQKKQEFTSVVGKLVRITPPLAEIDPNSMYGQPFKITRNKNGIVGINIEKAEERIERQLRKRSSSKVDGALQNSSTIFPSAPATTLTLTFDGLTAPGVDPTDNNLAVGPNHVIQTVNNASGTQFKIWNKNGTVAQAGLLLSSITGFTGRGDPVVLYDQLADRWMMSEFGPGGTTQNYLVMAVSVTANPTGAWKIYQYPDNSFFPDYPKYSVWHNAYYATTNDFSVPVGSGSSYFGSSVWAFDRTAMLAGAATATMVRARQNNAGQDYYNMGTIGLEGNTPSTQNGLFAVPIGPPTLNLFEFTPDFVTPSNSVVGPLIPLTIASYSIPPDGVAQQGTTKTIGTLGERLMFKLNYRNNGGTESIVITHTVMGSSSTLAAVRWYELRRTSGNWGVYQQGTIGGSDGNSRFMGGISMDQNGTIALMYNMSGSTAFPSIKYTGRNICDPLGQMTLAEQTIINGTVIHTFSGTPGTQQRWGDYNTTVLDPANGSFWSTAEYGNASTKIANFTLSNACACPPPAVTFHPSNTTVCENANTSFTVSATGGAPLTYQWRVSTNGGGLYNNLANGGVYSNVTTATMNITGATFSMNNYLYLCVVTGACSPTATSNPATLTVNPTVNSGTVSGTTPLCIGATATYTSNGTAGGTWNSTNSTVATVNSATGLVTAVSAGTTNITYAVVGCSSPPAAVKTLTVSPNASAGTVSGNSPLCLNATATYSSNGNAGGVWSSTSPGVATVNAATGLVTALTAGTTNITYTVNTGCNNPASAFKNLSVINTITAGTVSGTSPLCIGATATYTTNGTAGGTWSSTNASVASVNPATGLVTALAAGTTDITYTINGCTVPLSAFKTLTVSPNVTAGTVSGTSPVCAGTTASYTSNGTSGGTWSSSLTSVATVNASTGLVTAVNPGTTNITYTVSTGCNNPASAFKALTVINIITAGSVSGTSPLCIGASATYTTNGTAGGTWSSTNASVATVNSVTGQVTAVSAGTTNITYTINGCTVPVSAFKTLTVNPDVTTGTVSGTSPLVVGAAATFTSNGTGGGTWSSSSTSVATVNAATGAVTAVTAGTTDITYSVSGCGSPVPAFKTLNVISPNFIQGFVLKNANPAKIDVVFHPTYTSSAGEYVNYLQFSLAIPVSVSAGVTATAVGVNTFSNMGTLVQDAQYTEGSERIFTWIFANPAAATQSWTNGVDFTGVEVTFSTAAAAVIGKMVDFTLNSGGGNGNTYFAIVTTQGDMTNYSNLFYAKPGQSIVGNYASGDQFVQTSACTGAIGGTATGSASFCGSGTPAITASGYSTGTGSTYQWMSSTVLADYPSAGSAVIGQTDPSALTSGPVSSTTYFWLKVTCTSGTSTAYSNMITITVVPIPTATITPSGTVYICPPTSSQLLTSGTNAGSPTYVWKKDGVAIGGATNPTYSATAGGNYTVVITNASCSTTSASTIVVFGTTPATPTVTPSSANAVCIGNPQALTASSAAGSSSILSQNFESGIGSWTLTNNTTTTGTGNPALTAWTIRSHGYVSPNSSPVTFNSPGGTSFILSNADIGDLGTSVNTRLQSPLFSTVGYTAANLSFRHYYRLTTNPETYVEISTDGTTWTNLKTYTSDQGSSTGFVTDNINISAYVGFPTVSIRYRYQGGWAWYWAIDDIAITGTPVALQYSWTASPTLNAGLPAGAGTPSAANNSISATPTAPGTYTYTAITTNPATGCQSTGSTTAIVTVNANVTTGTVSGTTPLCIGATNTYSSNGTSGGTWSSSAPGIASVNAATGLVTALAAGTTNITYSVTGCGSPAPAIKTLTVSPNVTTGTVSGTSPLCIGATNTYSSNGTSGGAWSSTNTSVATVNAATGLVTALASGTTNITYSVTGCGSPAPAIKTLTVSPNVTTGTVSGTSPLCIGSTNTYSSNGTSGGTWSSTNTSVATVNAATGLVTALTSGSTDITYSVTGCGSPAPAIKTLTVSPNVTTGAISGTSPLCIGATNTYSSNGTSGGTWSSTNTSVAAVNAVTGLVTALTSGSTDITYSVTGCGSPAPAVKTLTVSPNVTTGTVSGTSPLCIGATNTYSSSGTSGGTWSSSVPGIASVNATTGLVTALTAGSTDITYSVTGCGSPSPSIKTLTVNPNVTTGIVSGTTPLCIGATNTYSSNGTSGGTWSSTNTSVATVDPATGLVTTLTSGTTDITYSLTGCGSPSPAIKTLTVSPNVTTGTVSGTSPLCIGATSSYSSNGSSGGTWTSTNISVATVDPATGLVTALASGTTDITYSLTGCGGPSPAIKTLTVSPNVTTGTVSGTSPLCIGAANTYSSSGASGGTWSSSAPGIASVDATTGLVTALASGTTDITYSVTGCGSPAPAIKTLTVSPNVAAGTINGASPIFTGTTTVFSSTGTSGGTWSVVNSSPAGVATVDAVTGLVTAVTAGTVDITYTVSGCGGPVSNFKTLTVNSAAPANDDAPGSLLPAYVLTVGSGCSGTPYTNTGATQSAGEPFAASRGSAGYHTVWYSFTAPASGNVRVSTDYSGGTMGSDSRLALYAATNVNNYASFTSLASDDDNGVTVADRSILYATGLTAGNTYYIQVDGKDASTVTGTFCLTVDEMTAAMISTATGCAAGQDLVSVNDNYSGWLSATDASGNLVALIQNPAGGATTSTYSNFQNIAGAVRTDAVSGQKYLNRNVTINNSTATNVNVRLFMLTTELTALIAADPGTTLANMQVTRQTGNVCDANFVAANGVNTTVDQTGNGSAAGFNWLNLTTPGFSRFYLHGKRYFQPLKVFLHGAFSTGLAGTAGRHKDVTATWALALNTYALNQPFTGAPFNYSGTESVAPGFFTSTAQPVNTDIVDWVLIELRDPTTPATMIARRAAFVREDGKIVDLDGVSDVSFRNVPAGNYHVAIRHRNHLGIRTEIVRTLEATMGVAPVLFDFSAAQANAHQDLANTGNTAMKALASGGVFGMWGANGFNTGAADNTVKASGTPASGNEYTFLFNGTNLNGSVVTIIGSAAAPVYRQADFNMDGLIKANGPTSSNDYLMLITNVLNGEVTKIITQHQ